MGLVELLLAALGVRRLQRPLVFILMASAALFFAAAAVAALVHVGMEFRQSEERAALLASVGGLGILFAVLALVSGYMVKRCFDPDQPYVKEKIQTV